MLKKLLIIAGILLLVFGAGCFTGHKRALNSLPEPKVDTVTVRDSIFDYNPEKTVLPAGYELVQTDVIEGTQQLLNDYLTKVGELEDSLDRKPKVIVRNDTTYVAVPMSRYHFTDNKTYECEATGYDVKMLWHKSYQETKYITKTVQVPTLPKFAISPNLDAMVGPNVLFLGAGVKVDVWSGKWRFSPGVDYGLVRSVNGWTHGPVVTFSAGYNIIIK